MNSTNPINFTLHQSSQGIIGTALPMASSRIGSDKQAATPSSLAGLMPHCLADETSKVSVRIPKEKPFLRCRKPQSIDHPDTFSILFTGNFSDFRSSDFRTTQDATKNCGSIGLSDRRIGGRDRNTLDALFKPKCSLYSFIFSILALSQIGQQADLARTLKNFKIDDYYIFENPHKIPLP